MKKIYKVGNGEERFVDVGYVLMYVKRYMDNGYKKKDLEKLGKICGWRVKNNISEGDIINVKRLCAWIAHFANDNVVNPNPAQNAYLIGRCVMGIFDIVGA